LAPAVVLCFFLAVVSAVSYSSDSTITIGVVTAAADVVGVASGCVVVLGVADDADDADVRSFLTNFDFPVKRPE